MKEEIRKMLEQVKQNRTGKTAKIKELADQVLQEAKAMELSEIELGTVVRIVRKLVGKETRYQMVYNVLYAYYNEKERLIREEGKKVKVKVE